MTLEARSRARLKELEEGRERFISDAQRQLAALDASIAEIKALLDPPPPAEQNGMTSKPIPAEVIDAPTEAAARA